MINLISGVLIPEKGKIFNNDYEVDYGSYIHLINYLPQNAATLNTSIKNNISFSFNSIISKEKIFNYLDFVMLPEFKHKIDLEINDTDTNISGGQKQDCFFQEHYISIEN